MVPATLLSTKRFIRRLAILVLAGSALALPAVAQDRTGIDGTVTDQSGALVPNVKVELKAPATGLTREAVTGATGIYEFPALPIGSYNITVSKAGFRPFEVHDIDLLYGQTRTVDVHVAHLRKILTGSRVTIETVTGVGYKLVAA